MCCGYFESVFRVKSIKYKLSNLDSQFKNQDQINNSLIYHFENNRVFTVKITLTDL